MNSLTLCIYKLYYSCSNNAMCVIGKMPTVYSPNCTRNAMKVPNNVLYSEHRSPRHACLVWLIVLL